MRGEGGWGGAGRVIRMVLLESSEKVGQVVLVQRRNRKRDQERNWLEVNFRKKKVVPTPVLRNISFISTQVRRILLSGGLLTIRETENQKSTPRRIKCPNAKKKPRGVKTLVISRTARWYKLDSFLERLIYN